MRFREFLIEYRRDITAKKLGDRIFTVIKNHPLLYRIGQLIFPQDENMLKVFDAMVRVQRFTRPFNVDITIDGETYKVNNNTANAVFEALKPQIIEAALKYIESKDPTANKQYTPWLARTVINNTDQNWEDLNRHDFLGIYHLGKQRRIIRPEHADINRFKTYEDFENVMWSKYRHDDILKPAEEQRGEAKEIYRDENVRVLQPQDQAAACYYGRGTRWCTAATRGDNYFDHFNNQGPLYILIPTKPSYEGEKYQIHFPSEQFMNETDEPVGFNYINKEFPGFIKYLADRQNPYIQQYIDYTPDEEIIKINNEMLDKFLTVLDQKVRNMKYQEFTTLSNRYKGYIATHPMDNQSDIKIRNEYMKDLKKYYDAETKDLLFVEQFAKRLKEYPVEKLRELFKSAGFSKVLRWDDFLADAITNAIKQNEKWEDSYQYRFIKRYPVEPLTPEYSGVRKIAMDWFRYFSRRS